LSAFESNFLIKLAFGIDNEAGVAYKLFSIWGSLNTVDFGREIKLYTETVIVEEKECQYGTGYGDNECLD
jgi:hypothetical protein